MAAQAFRTDDELLAHSLATGGTVAGAAKTARVSESTVYRRLREPTFRARVDELRAAVVDVVRGRVSSEAIDACDVLHRLLGSRSEAVQLRTAKTLVELALKLSDRNPYALPAAANVLPQAEPESLSAPVPRSTDPQEVGAVRPEPIDPLQTATPGPEAAAKSEDMTGGRGPAPGSVAAPAPGDASATSVPVARQDAPPPVTGEERGPNASARNLSKPVKPCHRPASRPPLNEVDRLSTGLSVALEAMSCG